MKIPILDIHGETTATMVFLVQDFINDNYKLGNLLINIVHGKGSGKLRIKTHELLKTNKKVKKYYLDGFNLGSTIVELYERQTYEKL